MVGEGALTLSLLIDMVALQKPLEGSRYTTF